MNRMRRPLFAFAGKTIHCHVPCRNLAALKFRPLIPFFWELTSRLGHDSEVRVVERAEQPASPGVRGAARPAINVIYIYSWCILVKKWWPSEKLCRSSSLRGALRAWLVPAVWVQRCGVGRVVLQAAGIIYLQRTISDTLPHLRGSLFVLAQKTCRPSSTLPPSSKVRCPSGCHRASVELLLPPAAC